MFKHVGDNYGLVLIITMCLGSGLWFYNDHRKSESLKPTTISEESKVEAEVESGSTPDKASPLDDSGGSTDPFRHKQTEEEVMASIVRNACLRRCPSGTVPVFIGDEVIGFFNHELASMTRFKLGDRLNL